VTVATVLLILTVAAKGVLRRVEPTPATLAALAAGAGLAVQSAIDFSVQIQAVAVTAVALLGAGLGEAVAQRRDAGRRDADRPVARPAPRPVPVVPSRFERVSVTIPTAGIRATAQPSSGEFQRVQVTIPTRESAPSTNAPAGTVPEGRRIYVFGDVHGRFDLVQRLRDAILRDRARSAPATVQVIGLGDFIDRGPDSMRVIEALTSDFFECDAAYIRGNHEQMLLDFLDDPEMGSVWLRNGARETLRSYGVDLADAESATRVDYGKLRTAFRARLPRAHAAFLADLPLSFVVGGYFFVHAGARPGVPLDQQKSSDMLWIRDGFADRDEQFEKIVVHGHTPVDRPYLGEYRINLDTGAYLTNRLSCLVLESRERRILEI
jgi:serine/threonine protein phosphatase 1